MTKLEEVIEHVKTLPAKEQDVLADWILVGRTKDTYELSPEELAEVERRLASNEPTAPAEKVFARLYKKYGSV